MRAVLRIDLDTFAQNLRVIRSAIAPAQHLLVLKDEAYGHGVEAIVARAADEGVAWFGAFDVGIAARARRVAGPDARIFVWSVPSAAEASSAIALDLDIGVGDAALLETIATAARADGRQARVHLKIDTGLHRNGIRPEEWSSAVDRAAELQSLGSIDVVGVWSHIAEASDADDDAARAVFDEAWDLARAAGLTPRWRHLAASAAGFARAEFRYDLVRIGAFAYGIRPAGGPGEGELGIRPIAALEAIVTAVGEDTVEIGIGALEGLPSTLDGRVSVATPAGSRILRLHDEIATVPAWPGAQVGDVVVVFGPGDRGEPSATDLGEAISTVGEEILVRISPLVPRLAR